MPMKQILLFSGTTEGRTLAEGLETAGIPCKICVATEYGREVMKAGDGITLHIGRLNREEMLDMMRQEEFLAVVDATHPFAIEVSENIRESAAKAGLHYLRLRRENEQENVEKTGNLIFVKSQKEAVERLSHMEGKILLTTGSKELPLYCNNAALRERLFVRVLPGEESIRICKEQGLLGRQIIAMQGPFSKELNVAVLKQFDISCMVTKESGETGGYPEKLAAAAELKIPVIVIENPEKRSEGASMTLREVEKTLEKITGKTICLPKMELVLAGSGMGAQGLFTVEVKDAIKNADYLIGAKRLLSSLPENWNTKAKKQPLYLAEDIFPYLLEEGKNSVKLSQGEKTAFRVVLLFSGDIGFYSGAKKVREAYPEWKSAMELQGIQTSIRFCPGISSVSYLSAKCGVSYQDARILSLHGRSVAEKRESDYTDFTERVSYLRNSEIEKAARIVEREKITFLITSGLSDVKALGEALVRRGLLDVRMTLGYQLSYPEEKILSIEPLQCEKLTDEGLYTCILENEKCRTTILTHGLPDDDFIRGKVPMTKEEVREICLCKLRLTEEAVLYDVGSGTGSIAVEAGRLSEKLKVYAIERKIEALTLIRENCKRHGLSNVEVIEGEAPEVLEKLPTPTHAFIGGSNGRLKEILKLLYKENPKLRVVITAVTLETIAEMTEVLREFRVTEQEVIQISVSRAKTAGKYHLMQAENPVYLMSFQFREEESAVS